MDPSLGSVYQPLDVAKSEIRLLKVPPKDSDETFEMLTVSLDDNPSFIALSYVWGDTIDLGSITIDGQSASIPRNLEAALSCIRGLDPAPTSPQRGLLIWADAICINQKDPTERGHQVGLMAQIFRSAKCVYSWLGSKNHSLAFWAIRTLALIARRNKTEGVLVRVVFDLEWFWGPRLCRMESSEGGKELKYTAWHAVEHFLEDPYWDRVWIFQEMVLARSLLFLSPGSTTLSWNDLEDATRGLNTRVLQLRDVEMMGLHSGAWKAVGMGGWSKPARVVIARQRVAMRMPSSRRRHQVFWDITTMASEMKATKPEDYIYGLLGISGLPITPDYSPTRSLSGLYTNYVSAWLRASRHRGLHPGLNPLAFLHVAGIGLYGPSADFPSWAPNYPKNSVHGVIVPQARRHEDDLMTGSDKEPYINRDTRSICTWGVEMGSIISLFRCPKAVDRTFLEFVDSFVTRHPGYVGGMPSLQAFLQLILGEYPPDTETISEARVGRGIGFLCFLDSLDTARKHNLLRPRKFKERLAKLLFPSANLEKIDFKKKIALYVGDGDNRHITRHLNKLFSRRAFFETASGYLGTAISGFACGDILCMLNGLDVPVVLRETQDCHFTFVGTAEVPGLMYGEAADLIRTGKAVPRRFDIR